MRTQTSVDGGMEHGASPREGRSKCDEVALHDRGATAGRVGACVRRVRTKVIILPARSQ